MKPPSCDAAKSTPPLPRDLHEVRRPTASSTMIGAPCCSAMRSASRLTETGSASRALGRGRAHELDEHEQRLVGRERDALVVDDRRGLAVGIEHEPRSEPEVRTRSPMIFTRVS